MKNLNWLEAVFTLIYWEAHRKSFSRLTRNEKIHICKIIHKLVNTNRQNHLVYGTKKSALAVFKMKNASSTYY